MVDHQGDKVGRGHREGTDGQLVRLLMLMLMLMLAMLMLMPLRSKLSLRGH